MAHKEFGKAGQNGVSASAEVMVIAWNERGSSIPDANIVTVRTETGIGIFSHTFYLKILPS